jgi:RNA polymerase sigma-70 factor, ECF subfamily
MGPPVVSDSPHATSDLLHRAAACDEAAAREFVEKLGPLVLRIIHAHSPLRREADDLLQDIFFRAFTNAAKFRGDAPVEHWLSRVAKCACLDRLRRLKVRTEITWSDLSASEQASFAHQASEPSTTMGEDARGLLERLFATLLPIDAWLLREVELHERPLAEVADEAGWSAPLTRVRLFRARHRLRAAYESLSPSHP